MITRPKRPIIPAILALIILIIGSLIFLYDYENRIDPPQFKLPDNAVMKVIDGDTIQLADNTIVRLLGINAPEQEEDCYEEAKERLSNLLLSYEVRLESDPAAPDTDIYGRKLRYIFLDNQNINLILLQEGLVRTYFLNQSLKYQTEFIAAEQRAIENQIGCLWN